MSDSTTATAPADPVATAARLVRSREDDDSRGLLFEGEVWTWREVVAEAGRRGELLLLPPRGRPVPCGGPPGEHPRVPVPAPRGRAGRCGGRGHQSHPSRCRARHRHPPRRLPTRGHRLDPGGAASSTWISDWRPSASWSWTTIPTRSGWSPSAPIGGTVRPAAPEPTAGPALPAHLHLGLDRRPEGGPDDPGAGGPGRLRGSASAPTTSSTRPCRSSMATPCRPRCCPHWPVAPPSRCGAGSRRPASCPTCASAAPPSSTAWGVPSPTSSPLRRPTTTGTTDSVRTRPGDVGPGPGGLHRALRRPHRGGVRLQ